LHLKKNVQAASTFTINFMLSCFVQLVHKLSENEREVVGKRFACFACYDHMMVGLLGSVIFASFFLNNSGCRNAFPKDHVDFLLLPVSA
jgi:hypothetical protein